jgi:hypothetical protein
MLISAMSASSLSRDFVIALKRTGALQRDCFSNRNAGTKAAMTVRVDGVVVVPMQDGYAYSHTYDGRCVVLAGPRDRMMELCTRVRQTQLAGGPSVYVNALDFPAYGFLPAQDCPLHAHAAA